MKKTLVCTAIGLACLPAYAEVFELGQIEVTTEKSTDLSMVRLDQTNFQQNHYSNVAEVAKSTPGVFFERKGGRNEMNLLVRGFDSRRVPVFIDGIPVYVPYDGNMDIGRFTLFDLAHIDISKGASSVLYGANTLGGAINLVTQKPTRAFEGSLGYGYQQGRNQDTATNQANFSLGIKQPYFYAQLSGSFVERQGLQLSRHFQPHSFNTEQGGRAENSVQRDKKLSLKIAATPNQTDEYALVLSTQKGAKQQPLYAGDVANSERYWRWPMWDKDSIYFLSHTQFAPHQLYVNTKVFYDSFKNDLATFDDATFQSQSHKGFNSFYRDYSFGAGVEVGGALTTADNLKFSAIIKQDVHREHDDAQPVATNKDRTLSIGLENTHHFTDQTALITGISWDKRQALRAEKYQKCDNGTEEICPFNVTDKTAFNYQIKLVHHFDQQDELALGFAKKTRFATMKDRYSRNLDKYKTPNPFLAPETAYHYELSYMRTFGDWLRLDGALFYSEVKDAIEEIATGQQRTIVKKKKTTVIDELMNQNYGKEVFRGVELAAVIFAGDDLTLGANYTYTQAKNKTNQDFLIRDMPKHKFFAYADWRFAPKFSLYVSQEAEHGRYSTNGMGKSATVVKLQGFGITNTKLTYQATPQFSVDAGVSNLFDKNYEYSAGFPEQGRVYFSTLRYQF